MKGIKHTLILLILFVLSSESGEPLYATRAWKASTTGSRSAMRGMT